MKRRHRRFLATLLAVIAIISWVAIRPEYSSNHDYYMTMIQQRKHRVMLLSGVGMTAAALTRSRTMKTTRKQLLLWFGVVVLFAMIHTGLKGGLSTAGIFGLLWKHAWILGIAVVHLMSIHAVGSWISDRLFRLSRTTTHIALAMAIGLVTNMIIMYILLLVGGMYPIVVWLIFVLMGVLIYIQRQSLQADYRILLASWRGVFETHSRGWRIQQGLLIAAIVYLLYGVQLAFIPYSTAWDANHAYMFFPKIWADNHGLYRSNGPWTSPFIWYSYIAQRFSSMSWLTPVTGLARDTMAVLMNFITSAVGILIMGTALFDAVARWFTNHKRMAATFSLMAGFLLLLWLTSGMGAFLVFVDNKTDMGIMLLVMVALLSGFVFLTQKSTETGKQTPTLTRYAMVSGFFFGVAFLGKPTAFLDIAGFVVMVISTQLGVLGVIGLAALIIGVMAAMQIRSTGTYLDASASKIALGGLLLIPAPWVARMQRSREWLRLLLIWGVIVIITIVLGKLPYLAQRAGGWSGSDWMRGLLLSSTQTQEVEKDVLLAATGETDNPYDTMILETQNKSAITPSLDQCSLQSLGMTMDELRDRQKEVVGGQMTEDNARYVGYGQRVLTSGNAGLWYGIASTIFSSDDGCYTADDLAGELCDDRDQLTTGGVANLVMHLSNEYEYISDLEEKLNRGDIFPQDGVSLLTEYYQSRTITTTDESVGIPYRRLVPLNITFNRSLQNRSSYYTDIGVVRLPALLIVMVGLIRGVIITDKKLVALTGATIVVWIAWMLVADAIVRYGMGMIIWTIIAAVAVLTRGIASTKNNPLQDNAMQVIMIVLAILGITQRLLNMMRISSQGAGGPFVSYKQGLGTQPAVMVVDDQLSASQTLQTMSQDDVFTLQFAHYNPIIRRLEQREADDGVFIAGTYLQYFLRDQTNIRNDNLVTSLRREMSDSDVCASYLRLRDTGYRTIILDPNIATVVLGEGNQSLKDRFIMKEDNSGQRIDDGVMSMMARLVMADYAELGFTNNIGIHYAYTLSSEDLIPYMEKIGETDEVTFRTRLAMVRFLPDGLLQEYVGIVGQLLVERFGTYDGMQDMGRIYGEELGTDAWEVIASSLEGAVSADRVQRLTDNERLIVYKYIQLVSAARRPQTQSQVQQELSQIMQRSISGQSQIVSFVLK